MNTIRQYIATLDTSTLESIVESNEQFERDGFTDETPIRVHTVKVMKQNNAESTNVTMWFNYVMTEVYRELWFREKQETIAIWAINHPIAAAKKNNY
jgi:hypothetical protein